MSGPWELPYEEVPGGPVPLDVTGLFVDHANIRAAVMDTPLGVLPVVIFDFSSSAGGALPPVVYASTVEGLRALRRIVNDSIAGAIRAADQGGFR